MNIAKEFKNISFSGSPLANEQNDFFKGLLPIYQEQQLLEKDLISKKDSSYFKKGDKEDLIRKENDYYLEWTKKHLNSPFSVAVICFYAQQVNVSLLEKVYNDITAEAKENNLVVQRIPLYFAIRKQKEKFEIGNHLKDFVLNDTFNKPQPISNLIKNNYVLIDIWATWCSPCRKSVPVMKELWDKYHNRNFMIISISADTDFKLWKEVIKKDKMNWYHLSDLNGNDSGFIKDNYIYAYPTYILVSPEGIIFSKPYDIERVKEELTRVFENK